MQARFMTVSGHEMDLLDIRPSDIKIGDIAHHLAMTVRFTGAVGRPYNNGQHSCLVSDIAASLCQQRNIERKLAAAIVLCAHVHDGGEAYTGDASAPMKRAMRHLSPPFRGFRCVFDYLEHSALVCVESAFKLPTGSLTDPENEVAVLVKEADLMALHIEDTVLRPYTGRDADLTLWHGHCWSFEEARSHFLMRFARLYETYEALAA